MARSSRPVNEPQAGKRSIRLVLLVTLIFVVVLSVGIVKNYRTKRDLDMHMGELRSSIAEAEAARESLEELKDRELTDEDMIKIARERFGLVFPNEIIFIPED